MNEIGQSDGAQNDPYEGGGSFVVREASGPVTVVTVGQGVPQVRVVVPESNARVSEAVQMYIDLVKAYIVTQIPRFPSFSEEARTTHLEETVKTVVRSIVQETGGNIAPADVAHRVITSVVHSLSEKLRLKSGEAA